LRKRGHHLKAMWVVGREGLTETVVRQVDRALDDHGLIKIRLRAEDREETRHLAQALAERAGGHVIQVVGRVALLYRAASREGESP